MYGTINKVTVVIVGLSEPGINELELGQFVWFVIIKYEYKET